MLQRLLLLALLDCRCRPVAVSSRFPGMYLACRSAASVANVALNSPFIPASAASSRPCHSTQSTHCRRNLIFEALDVTGGMPELKQSSVDCVVDAGLLDKLVTTQVHQQRWHIQTLWRTPAPLIWDIPHSRDIRSAWKRLFV